MTLVVKGRTVHLDHLRNTDLGYYNIEGQGDQYQFPIKRHFYHWAVIFASQLQAGGKYADVTPVTVIVFYKDRGKARPLMQKAVATGDLMDDVDTQFLNLIAVNTAKWYKADDDKFKYYLALLHHGIDEETLSEKGIDVSDSQFTKLRDMFRRCCAQQKALKARSEGDEEMEKMLVDIWEERGIEKGIEIGTEKGIEIGINKGEIKVYYNELKLSPEEIAKKMNLPLKKVVETVKTLQSVT